MTSAGRSTHLAGGEAKCVLQGSMRNHWRLPSSITARPYQAAGQKAESAQTSCNPPLLPSL